MADPLFGLELMFHAHRGALRNPADAALLFVHWTLVSSGLQAQHSAPDASAEKHGSELLPQGWNGQEDVYEVTYVDRERSEYLLKTLVVEEQLITNMSKLGTDRVASYNKQVSEIVSDNLENFNTIYKNAKPLKDELVQSLVDVVAPSLRPRSSAEPSVTSQVGSRGRPTAPAADPLRVPGTERRPDHPLAVGGADLDPLGRGIGGGMLMDPRRPPSIGQIPAGVPPGARFDPFGPPDLVPRPGPGRGGRPGRFPGEPNPDHLRMPGFDDNMFL